MDRPQGHQLPKQCRLKSATHPSEGFSAVNFCSCNQDVVTFEMMLVLTLYHYTLEPARRELPPYQAGSEPEKSGDRMSTGSLICSTSRSSYNSK